MTDNNVIQTAIEAIGPTWPVFAVGFVFQLAILILWILQKTMPGRFAIQRDMDFLHTLGVANARFARIALLVGFAGTYIGIWESLPALSSVVQGKGAEAVTQTILGLQNAFVSTLAGIILGPIWAGELSDILLAGFTKDVPLHEGPAEEHLNPAQDAPPEEWEVLS